MKNMKMSRYIQVLFVAAIMLFSFPSSAFAADVPATTYDVDSIPLFDEYVWVTLEKDSPVFPEELLTTSPYAQLSPLDDLGRPGAAIACLGPETIMADYDYMPTRDSYKPSGWQDVNDPIFSRPIYRCARLIEPSLYPGLDVAENYFTATEDMSGLELTPFENGLYRYIKETGNHVLLRMTPVYEGDNLLCSGVLIEEWSIEEPPDGYSSTRRIAFVYNAEPHMTIDYSTGLAQPHGQGAFPMGLSSALYEHPVEASAQSVTKPAVQQVDYVLNTNTMKFHYPHCASVDDIKSYNRRDYSGTRDEVLAMGYSPCGRCKP